MSDPLLFDIDEARSDNASLMLENMDRTCSVILAGAATLDTFKLGLDEELVETVNVAGVPPEDEDAMTRARSITGSTLYG